MAEKIAKYPGSKEDTRNIQVLDHILYWYLLDCYRHLPHPSSKQWPSRHSPPFSIRNQCHFFDLILYEAPLNEIESQSHKGDKLFKTVTLNSALTKCKDVKGLLVYFEAQVRPLYRGMLAGSGQRIGC